MDASPTVAPSDSEAVTVRDSEPWIAFQWLDEGGDAIFLVRPDGTDRHQLAADLPGSEIHPEWSPDGARIAFIHITPDGHELWIVEADGRSPELLFSCDDPCNTISYPAWAPDDTAIYFAQDADASPGQPPTTFMVGKVDLGTGEASVVLTREDGMTAEQPQISPDGTTVAYTRFRDILDNAAGSAIFVADLEGGSETQLTEWGLFGAYPDWTPDGRIVFNSYDLGAFQDTAEGANLYVMNADGSELQPLTDYVDGDVRATQPRAAPDGSGIAFTHVEGAGIGTRTMAFIALDGSEPVPLTPEPLAGTHPQLRPITH